MTRSVAIQELSIHDMASIFDVKEDGKLPILIIPVGAVEVYGPHLPLGSDSLVSYSVARLLAEKVNALVAPPINYGVSEDLMDFPGTFSVSLETMVSLLRDICESASRQGFKKVFFFCGHLGNLASIREVAYEAMRKHGLECAMVDWWRYVYEVNRDVVETTCFPEGHASEVGTSVLLYLFPELVDMNLAVREEPDRNQLCVRYGPHLELFTYMKSWTSSGVIGDPTKATGRKGEVMVKRAVDELASFLEVWGRK